MLRVVVSLHLEQAAISIPSCVQVAAFEVMYSPKS